MTWRGLAAGTLGGATTMLVRAATRRAIRAKKGPPRAPAAMGRRPGVGTVLAWAAAAGVLLAIADLLIEQSADTPLD